MTDDTILLNSALNTELNVFSVWPSVSDPKLNLPAEYNSDYPSAAQFFETFILIDAILKAYSELLEDDLAKIREIGEQLQQVDLNIGKALDDLAAGIAGTD
jgi:hypothetical protein